MGGEEAEGEKTNNYYEKESKTRQLWLEMQFINVGHVHLLIEVIQEKEWEDN